MVAGSDPPEPAGGTVHIAVVGASRPSDAQTVAAELVGAGLARAGAIVITGGGPGVMAAASKGAATAGGTVVGILPGTDRAGANPWVGVALVTGVPVVGYDTWDIPGIEVADSPEQAVAMALERAARGPI
jgi:hypothetical protein